MKKLSFFCILASLLLASCDYVEFQAPKQTPESIEKNSSVMLKSAAGYNSLAGTIYVQQGIVTGLKIESKVATKVISKVTWKIEGANYEGTLVSHKFTSLGKVVVTVSVEFTDGTTEDRDFTVQSIVDISTADPVKCFVTGNTDGTWTVLFLFSKERIKSVTDTAFYYNGLVNNWGQKIRIPIADKNYVIGIDGKPQRTTDIGKYIGASVILKNRGLYNIALIDSTGNWVDLSGSIFIRQENTGLAWFFFDDGVVTSSGDNSTGENLPGATGDSYFRFEQTGDTITGKTTLYFKLDSTYTANAFAVQELSGGTYSTPLLLNSVDGFSDWGKIEISTSELIGEVSGFRYGPDKNYPTVFSKNMTKSFSYDTYFKNIRFSLLNI
jgi:hypothetical protein